MAMHDCRDVLPGRSGCVTDPQDFLSNLNESPDLRVAAILGSLTRIAANWNDCLMTASKAIQLF